MIDLASFLLGVGVALVCGGVGIFIWTIFGN